MTDPDLPSISHEAMKAWLEHDEAPETPLLTRVWGPPLCAQRTMQERVEPYYTRYRELSWELPWYEDGPPDEAWYTPTQKLIDLVRRVAALRKKAFRTVPNPAYTDECAAAWDAKRGKPFSQVQITVGQSYNSEALP